jgi:hypothetical protein
MTLRDEFEGLWPIPNNVIFDELSQEYHWRGYPNTTSPVNDLWESFCDGARVQQNRVEELEAALRDLLSAVDYEQELTTARNQAEKALSRQGLRRAVTMDDAVQAGNSVLLNEQAMLLRECRAALDDLVKKKPGIEALHCGSTTIGNLRASLGKHRPQGVMGVERLTMAKTAQERTE